MTTELQAAANAIKDESIGDLMARILAIANKSKVRFMIRASGFGYEVTLKKIGEEFDEE